MAKIPTAEELKTKGNKQEESTKKTILEFMENVLKETGASNPENIMIIYNETVKHKDFGDVTFPVYIYDLKDIKSVIYNLEMLKKIVLDKVTSIEKGKQND